MFDVIEKYKPLVIFFLLSYLFVILLALPAMLTIYAAGVVINYGPERLTRKDEILIDFKGKYWDGL